MLIEKKDCILLMILLISDIDKVFIDMCQGGVVIEAVARKCSVKKVFLRISQNSKENISPERRQWRRSGGLIVNF